MAGCVLGQQTALEPRPSGLRRQINEPHERRRSERREVHQMRLYGQPGVPRRLHLEMGRSARRPRALHELRMTGGVVGAHQHQRKKRLARKLKRYTQLRKQRAVK